MIGSQLLSAGQPSLSGCQRIPRASQSFKILLAGGKLIDAHVCGSHRFLEEWVVNLEESLLVVHEEIQYHEPILPRKIFSLHLLPVQLTQFE